MKIRNLYQIEMESAHKDTVSAWNLFREEDFQSHILWFNDNLVQPGEIIEPHVHEDVEEVYYIIEGKGKTRIGGEEKEVSKGDAVYIPSKEEHSLKNIGTFPLRFICIGGRIERN